MLMRAMSSPPRTSPSITSGDPVAGPSVQTTLVRSISGSGPLSEAKDRAAGAGAVQARKLSNPCTCGNPYRRAQRETDRNKWRRNR